MRTLIEILTIAAGVALGTGVLNFGLALLRAYQMREEVERLRAKKQALYRQMFEQSRAEKEGQQG